jgi:hypothetical protein
MNYGQPAAPSRFEKTIRLLALIREYPNALEHINQYALFTSCFYSEASYANNYRAYPDRFTIICDGEVASI